MARKTIKKRGQKASESAEHRLVQLARRCNLFVRFDADLKCSGGEYITLVDGAGNVAHQCGFVSLASIWIAKRLKAGADGKGRPHA